MLCKFSKKQNVFFQEESSPKGHTPKIISLTAVTCELSWHYSGETVRICVWAQSRQPTSYTHYNYSLIPQIPLSTFMVAIFCVITSFSPTMKMVFMLKMSPRSQTEGALVCGHGFVLCISTKALSFSLCISVYQFLCVSASVHACNSWFLDPSAGVLSLYL